MIARSQQFKATKLKRAETVRRTRLARKTNLAKKPTKPKTLDDVLKDLCRRIIMLRDGFVCRRCKKGIRNSVVLQVHHIRTQGAQPALKWELANLLLVCKGCHFALFHNRDSERAAEWYRENLGQPHLDHLRLLAQVRKGKKTDKQAVKLFLEQTLEQLTALPPAEPDSSESNSDLYPSGGTRGC